MGRKKLICNWDVVVELNTTARAVLHYVLAEAERSKMEEAISGSDKKSGKRSVVLPAELLFGTDGNNRAMAVNKMPKWLVGLGKIKVSLPDAEKKDTPISLFQRILMHGTGTGKPEAVFGIRDEVYPYLDDIYLEVLDDLPVTERDVERRGFVNVKQAKRALDNGHFFMPNMTPTVNFKETSKLAEKAFAFLKTMPDECDGFSVGKVDIVADEDYLPFGVKKFVPAKDGHTYKDFVDNTNKLYGIVREFDTMQQYVVKHIVRMVLADYNNDLWDAYMGESVRPRTDLGYNSISSIGEEVPVNDKRKARKIVVETLKLLAEKSFPELDGKPVIANLNDGKSLDRVQHVYPLHMSQEFVNLLWCVDACWLLKKK